MYNEDVVIYKQWNITQLQKENKIMVFTVTWMSLEIVRLNEVRHRQISYDITYTWNLKKWYK